MPTGLEAVFLENRTSLLRFLRARGGGDMAEDLLQELWIKAAAGVSEPLADPLAYLYRTANNLVIDRHRSDTRRSRREQDWTESGAWSEATLVAGQSGERVIAAREHLRTVEAALAQLGDRTEAIFRRFRIDGATQSQIAQEMGISLSAVEKHLQKAYRAVLDVRRRLDAG